MVLGQHATPALHPFPAIPMHFAMAADPLQDAPELIASHNSEAGGEEAENSASDPARRQLRTHFRGQSITTHSRHLLYLLALPLVLQLLDLQLLPPPFPFSPLSQQLCNLPKPAPKNECYKPREPHVLSLPDVEEVLWSAIFWNNREGKTTTGSKPKAQGWQGAAWGRSRSNTVSPPAPL